MASFDAEAFARWQRRSALAVKLVLVVLAFGVLPDWIGPVAYLVGLALLAQPLAHELQSGFAALYHRIRGLAYGNLEGAHYAFKGVAIRVQEPVPGERWLSVDDLARALGEPIRVVALRETHQDGVQRVDGVLCIHARACVDYLSRREGDRVRRLQRWVDQVVWKPSGEARRLSGRGG